MPTARMAKISRSKTGIGASFVALVLMFNLVLANLSSAVAYAKTLDETPASEQALEATEKPDETEEAPVETTAPSEEEEETNTPDIDEDESVEEENQETNEVSANQLEPAFVEIAELDVDYQCYVRDSLTEYRFFVDVESNADQTLPAGEAGNMASPSEYNSILPEEFLDDDYLLEVSGWDGGDFTWMIGGSEVHVSTENEPCDGPTIADVIDEEASLDTLDSVISYLIKNKACEGLLTLDDSYAGPYTVFAPENSAFAALVAAPQSIDAELTQLLGNPDEMCALLGSHVVEGVVVSTDATTDGATLNAVVNDLDGIFVQNIGGKVFVDGHEVVSADLFATNGVVHIIDGVLLPQSVGTINQVVTTKTSPALSGTINMPSMSAEEVAYELCVVVRIDGVPYIADVSGNTWMIEEGVVSLNPTKENTLFDVVVRTGLGHYYASNGASLGCEEVDVIDEELSIYDQEIDIVTHGGPLLGLTMSNTVVSYDEPTQPEEPEEEEGEVLGETTDEEVVEEDTVALVPTQACGKGDCGSYVAQTDNGAGNEEELDSDGDGVPDSEDPEPFNPDIDGTETDDEANDEEADDDSNANLLLWFIAGGGIVVVWYLLWQRSGKEL